MAYHHYNSQNLLLWARKMVTRDTKFQSLYKPVAWMSLKDTEDSHEFGLHGEGTGNLFQSSILLHLKMCNRKVSKVKHGFVCKEELQGIESSDLKIFPGLEKQLLHNLKGKR